MYNFLLCSARAYAKIAVHPIKHKEDFVKKTHLLTKPTRVQDINFDDLDDGIDTHWSDRAEKSRIKSYRRLRHQES
jgi:hypothetical protein